MVTFVLWPPLVGGFIRYYVDNAEHPLPHLLFRHPGFLALWNGIMFVVSSKAYIFVWLAKWIVLPESLCGAVCLHNVMYYLECTMLGVPVAVAQHNVFAASLRYVFRCLEAVARFVERLGLACGAWISRKFETR